MVASTGPEKSIALSLRLAFTEPVTLKKRVTERQPDQLDANSADP